MKKTIFIFSFLSLSLGVFSQTNKPNIGDFGIKVGVNIPNIGLGLTFSRQLKKNLECGASAGFSFSSTKSSQATATSVSIITSSGLISGNQEYTYRYLNYTIAVSPFLVYHIPLNNNLDVFAGGRLSFSINRQVNYTSIIRNYTTNYESKTHTNILSPFSFSAGAGALIGADYYFRKNMAIGVSGNIGFGSTFQFGTETNQVTQTNSGSLNPTQGTTYSEQKWFKKNVYTNTGVSGSVGINFSFFFTRQATKRAA